MMVHYYRGHAAALRAPDGRPTYTAGDVLIDSDSEARSVVVVDEDGQGLSLKPLYRMTCCCCGGEAWAMKQWHNRDTGYGLCGSCASRLASKFMVNDYGHEGIHWFAGLPDRWKVLTDCSVLLEGIKTDLNHGAVVVGRAPTATGICQLKKERLVYVLFHETNSGSAEAESDGYVEGVYDEQGAADGAMAEEIRAHVKAGKRVAWDPETQTECDEWDHDWRVEVHQVLSWDDVAKTGGQFVDVPSVGSAWIPLVSRAQHSPLYPAL